MGIGVVQFNCPSRVIRKNEFTIELDSTFYNNSIDSIRLNRMETTVVASETVNVNVEGKL